MDALFAVQSLLHCLAVFGSAIADCDKASSPTNAAHKAAATFGFITHPSGKTPPNAYGSVSGQELPRWEAANLRRSPDRQLWDVLILFSICQDKS
jgi:hypothetical protein